MTDWTYYSKINNNETLLDYLLLLFFFEGKRELRYYQSVILGFIFTTELKSVFEMILYNYKDHRRSLYYVCQLCMHEALCRLKSMLLLHPNFKMR